MRKLAILSLGLAIIMGIVSCSNSESGYLHLEADNEICHISLEYPGRYDRVDVEETIERWGFYVVYFELDEKEQPMIVPGAGTQMVTYVPGSMEINIYDASPRNVMALDEIERELKAQQRWPGFELLERTTITVGAINAEYAFSVNNTLHIFPAEPGEDPPPRYIWEVYFDYNGLIWNMSAFSEESMVESVGADFEHLLTTFKILE